MCLQGRYSPEATWSTFSPYVATITVTQIRSLFFSSLFRWKQKDFRLGDERIEQEVRDKEIDDLLDFWPYYQVIGVNISWSSALAWRNNENYFELFFEVWNQVQIQVALFSNDLNETAIGNLDDRSIWRRKWKRCIGNTTWTKWNDSKEIIEKEIGDRFGEVLLETKVENKTKCEVRAAHLIFVHVTRSMDWEWQSRSVNSVLWTDNEPIFWTMFIHTMDLMDPVDGNWR